VKNRIIRVRRNGGTKAVSLQSPTNPDETSAGQGIHSNQTTSPLSPELQELTAGLDREELIDLAAELENRAAQVRLAAGNSAAVSVLGNSLDQANAVLDPALSEFTMDLGVPGRVLLAERFAKWGKQLNESVAVLRGLQFIQANPNN
jgi:hypothetical protein